MEAAQHSAEWMEARRGKVTGSRLADALTRLKSGKWSQKREDYMVELVAERLTKSTANHYTSKAMEWGQQTEPHAVAAYEFLRDVQTERVGFVPHPTILGFGASPDRLVGDDGVLEIKCLTTREHIRVLLANAMPEEYLWQVWGELACTGRAWCDWVSFDPRLPPEMQLWSTRITREAAAEDIEAVEGGVRDFLAEMEQMVADLWEAVRR